MSLVNIAGNLWRHPMAQGNRAATFSRFLRWQIGSRVLNAPIAVSYVEDTRLLVETGMAGATGNIYFGLHEFESMGFVLHALRETYTFIDVGANVGSYTVLAAGAVGTPSVALEPTPSNFEHLKDNVRLNDLEDKTTCYNTAVGSESGTLQFHATGTPMDRVLDDIEAEEKTLEVEVSTLDDILNKQDSVLVAKIDVEGWEYEVLEGAERILDRQEPTALIVELDGAGKKYGFDDSEKHSDLIERGFTPARYNPPDRSLDSVDEWKPSGNTIYVNNIDVFTELTAESKEYSVIGKKL